MRWVAGLAAALVVGASGARAAPITASFYGTIQDGIDVAGSFGSAGANLAGDPYSLVFNFDDSLGTFVGPQDLLEGCTGCSIDPVESVTLTIAGVSYATSFSDGVGRLIWGRTSGPYLDYNEVAIAEDGTQFFAETVGGAIPPVNFSYSPGVITADNLCQFTCATSFSLSNGDSGDFLTTSLVLQGQNVTNFALPVPEPSSWGLLIVGIGGIGLRIRRSRHLPQAFSPT
jgi:hypothetical protein